MYDACVPWPERPKGAKDKSSPKGLELEVGARRAPKLLVYLYIYLFITFIVSKYIIQNITYKKDIRNVYSTDKFLS